MQASIILPIVAVLSLFVKLTLGIEIGEELQAKIADAVLEAGLVIVTIIGVIKAHKSKKLTNLQ